MNADGQIGDLNDPIMFVRISLKKRQGRQTIATTRSHTFQWSYFDCEWKPQREQSLNQTIEILYKIFQSKNFVLNGLHLLTKYFVDDIANIVKDYLFPNQFLEINFDIYIAQELAIYLDNTAGYDYITDYQLITNLFKHPLFFTQFGIEILQQWILYTQPNQLKLRDQFQSTLEQIKKKLFGTRCNKRKCVY